MLSIRRLIVAGAAVFLIGLVVLFPARVAYDLLAPPTLRLSAINGTVWRGTAAEGEVAGLYLRNLEWTMRPLALFTGRIEMDVSVSPAGGFLEARASARPSGRIDLEDLEGGIAISALKGLVPAPGIEGNIRFSFERLAFEDEFPVAADGSLEVLALVVRGLSPNPIGDFRARLSSSDGAISGSIEDMDGALDVAGSLRLDADRRYVLDGLVAPTPNASSAIVNQLQFLGSANERGQRPFRLEGQL